MTEELRVDEKVFNGEVVDYDVIREAVKKLSSVSQEQFEEIKKEKWYNRVFDMVTFSQKGKRRLAEQIGTLAQAQQIFVELLLRLSSNDTNISKIVSTSMEDIRKIQEQNIYLLSRIKKLENVSLGMKPDADINKLSEKGKQVLSAYLYMINAKKGETSEEQKAYANSVLSYLAIDVQMEHPISALESMDNESKRKILSCCMEYIFLKNCSDDAYKEYEELIEEFDFGNKTIKSIKEQIAALYNLRGCEGFLLKYKTENFEDIGDSFTFDFEDQEKKEVVMEDEYISSILLIPKGETKIFKNKKIHIRAYVSCIGKMEIDHCMLYYNETNTDNNIKLEDDAELHIKDSLVICKGYNENFFISGNKNHIIFETTTFIDCAYFLSSSDMRFLMIKCKLENCFSHFLESHIGYYRSVYYNICENIILQNGLAKFYLEDNVNVRPLIEVHACSCVVGKSRVQFKNNTIIEKDKFKGIKKIEREIYDNLYNYWYGFSYFVCSGAIVLNCFFEGMSSAIVACRVKRCKFVNCSSAIQIKGYGYKEKGDFLIDNCVFQNCTFKEGNFSIKMREKGEITNCQFISCHNGIIEIDYDGGVNIEYCQFVNIEGEIINPSFSLHRPCIRFARRGGSEGKINFIKKCVFDNIRLHNYFLIDADGYEKPSGTVAEVESCDFGNCFTERNDNKIIKEYMSYRTLLNKYKDFHAIYICNCRGLDRVNKENIRTENVEVKTIATTGEPIGVNLDEKINIGAPDDLEVFERMAKNPFLYNLKKSFFI